MVFAPLGGAELDQVVDDEPVAPEAAGSTRRTASGSRRCRRRSRSTRIPKYGSCRCRVWRAASSVPGHVEQRAGVREHEPAPGPQQPRRLGDRPVGVAERHRAVVAEHDVERAGPERHRLARRADERELDAVLLLQPARVPELGARLVEADGSRAAPGPARPTTGRRRTRTRGRHDRRRRPARRGRPRGCARRPRRAARRSRSGAWTAWYASASPSQKSRLRRSCDVTTLPRASSIRRSATAPGIEKNGEWLAVELDDRRGAGGGHRLLERRYDGPVFGADDVRGGDVAPARPGELLAEARGRLRAEARQRELDVLGRAVAVERAHRGVGIDRHGAVVTVARSCRRRAPTAPDPSVAASGMVEPTVSPMSGISAARYTSCTTPGWSAVASVITAPPYEWPHTTTGPVDARRAPSRTCAAAS